MNSKHLLETGFSECHPLKTLSFSSLPQDKSSVIVIFDQELLGRPESDILYIGRTKKPLKKVLGGFLAGYGGKNTKKINQLLFEEGYIEKAAISWVATDKPRIMQKELLAKFKEDHGELPVWNAKKKLSVKSKGVATSKPEKAPALKPKVASSKPKTIAKPLKTSGSNHKIIQQKKPIAKEETPIKTAPESKVETAAETLEKQKLKNETASDSQMKT
jgi:hypothetical protein